LNSYVSVNLHVEKLDYDYLTQFQVVVLTDSSFDEQINMGKFCHMKQIKFLVAETRGTYGKIFCDFGHEFHVHDTNGQAAKTRMISFISSDDESTDLVVTTFEDQRHDLEDGDCVRIDQVKGMDELNGKEFKIKVLSKYDLY
jgi:ubiquitin-activating enzyme E1